MKAKKDQSLQSLLGPLQAKLRQPNKRFSALHSFRSSFPENLYFQAYSRLFPLRNSLQGFFGPNFPQAPALLLANKSPKIKTNAFREIIWSIARATQFGEELGRFLVLREAFEISILKNDHGAALSHLQNIRDEFGISIWWLQNRLAAAYISADESEPADIAKEISEGLKSNQLAYWLFHYIRRRAEGAVLRDKLKGELAEKIGSSTYITYFQAKVFDITNSSDDSVSSLLFVDSQASLIDHYDSLVHVLQAAAADQMMPESTTGLIRNSLERLFGKTADKRLLPILTLFGGGIVHYQQQDERAEIIEHYTAARYDECTIAAALFLEKSPADSAIRIIYIKALASVGGAPPKTSGLQGQLNKDLYSVFSADEHFFRSAHSLLIVSDRYYDHSWMLYLRVSVLYEIDFEQNNRLQRWMSDIIVRDPYITPLTLLCLNEVAAKDACCQIKSDGRFPITLNLFEEIINSSLVGDYSPRSKRYRARELLASGKFDEAAEFYKQSAQDELKPTAKLRALGGAAFSLMKSGKFADAINLAIDAHLDCPNAPTIQPLAEIVNTLPEPHLWPNTIKLSLLLCLTRQVEDETDLNLLRFAFEKFCEENQIFTPTQLHESAEKFGQACVVEFLDKVWQPEVMRQTMIYRSAGQIDEARIEACRLLVQIDPKRARTHQEELASRVKQQEIYRATELVEKSRVYVDIESIKRALRNRLKSSYAQYKNLIAQHGKPQDEFVRTFEDVFSDLDAKESLLLVLSKVHILDEAQALTPSDIQFSAIFGEITKEFLLGDHGLNAYLSTRVRHGKFIDALRKSLMDEQLVTARGADNVYALNFYWADRLGVDIRNAILTSLEDFTRSFDDLLLLARDRKMQIQTYFDLKGSGENKEGLLEYHFSALERRLVQQYDVEFKDFDELIVKCVDTLWEKTDANMIRVRAYLSGEFRTNVIALFDKLGAELSPLASAPGAGLLLNAIATSRTATQQALDGVIDWFRRNEVYDRQDFDVDLPPQIAASMVQRTMSMQNTWVGPNCVVDRADGKLPGRSLDALVDIFYVLMENSVKYAEGKNIPLEVNLNLSFVRGEFSGRVTSKARPPTAEDLIRLEQIRENLASQDSRRLAQSEGRSGFRKIFIALDNPLFKSKSLSFSHEASGAFLVEFRFKVAEQL